MTGIRCPDGTVREELGRGQLGPTRMRGADDKPVGQVQRVEVPPPARPERDGEREWPAGDYVTDDVLHLGLHEVAELGARGRPDSGDLERTIAARAMDAKLEPAWTTGGHREIDHVVPGPIRDGVGRRRARLALRRVQSSKHPLERDERMAPRVPRGERDRGRPSRSHVRRKVWRRVEPGFDARCGYGCGRGRQRPSRRRQCGERHRQRERGGPGPERDRHVADSDTTRLRSVLTADALRAPDGTSPASSTRARSRRPRGCRSLACR